MAKPKSGPDAASLARIADERRRLAEIARRDYRDRALKLLPHVCASCGREFSGKRLKELTVHHRDGDYKNNPSDGSNWELLCIYCHDYEHERHSGSGTAEAANATPGTFNMFADLDTLLKPADTEAQADEDDEIAES